MRFYHTADIHLGAAPDASYPWGEQRREEIWKSFRRLIEQAEKEKIDLLLIAGDLFHRQPLLRELKEVNYLFSTLTYTKVVLIIGNHDYLKRESYYWNFPWSENVICITAKTGEKITIPELNTSIYGLSYHTREIRESLYDRWKAEEDGSFSILMAHGGDEKHIPINRQKLLSSGFDYIALGHIHKPQILAENRMAYPGALEPLDKTELGTHGYISGVWERGKLQIRFVPWAERGYELLEIVCEESDTDFSLEEKLRQQIRERGREQIYRIHLTGFRDPDMLFQTERYQKLGNIVEIQDDTQPSFDFETLLKQHRGNLIGCYIEKLYHPEMSETERKALYYGVQAMLEGGV